MKRRRLRTFTIVFILLSGLLVCLYPAVRAECAAGSGKLVLEARSREPVSDGTDRFRVVQKKLEWEPKQTAIIICDMWDQHWCKGATSRVGELGPRMNEIVRKARDKGVLIVHAPSGTVDFYEGHPARRLAQNAPKAANLPGDISKWCRWIDKNEETLGYPIDHSDGGCDCQPQCKQGSPWRKQVEAIERRLRGHELAFFGGIYMNGTFVGGSEYSLKDLQVGGPPHQLMLGVHDTYGVSWSRKLFLADPRNKPEVPIYS